MLPGIGQSSCTDVMLMIRPPPPWAIICFAASCVPKNALLRLISSTFSYCASVVSSTDVRVSTPALLTMMSSRPNCFTAASTSVCRSSTLLTSAFDADGLVAERDDLLLEVFGRVGIGDVVDDDVRALPRASASTIDLPIPVLPPVTIATLPFSVMGPIIYPSGVTGITRRG